MPTPVGLGEVRLDSRSGIPGPPRRHEELQRRKSRGRSEDGLPLHSFPSLLQELATCSRRQCRMRSDPEGPLLIRLTDPAPLQRRAMEPWRAFPVNNTPNQAATPL